MVELLLSYENVPDKVMEQVLKYKAGRDKEFYQKYKNQEIYDDADIVDLLAYSDEEIIEYVDDLLAEKESAQPSQERPTQPASDQSSEIEAIHFDKCKRLKKARSKEPDF